MIKSSRVRWILLVVIGMAGLFVLWRIRGGSPQPIQARLLKKSELTPAEIKYGRAPQRDSAVVYQPDVIIVEGGAEVIRSEGPDPLTWTIDAHARHASSLEVGKIAFVTGRCVGRVLTVKKNGDNLSMILGPVDLTEIYRKLDLTVNEPVDLTEAIQNPVPQYPGLKLPVEGKDTVRDDLTSAVRMPDPIGATEWLRQPAAFLKPAQYRLVPVQDQPGAAGILALPPPMQFQATKALDLSAGPGIDFYTESGGVRFRAQVQLRLKKPRLEVHIGIDDGKVNGIVILHNAAGLLVAFDSATGEGFTGNVNWYSPGGSITIPIGGPVPLAADFRHDLWISTAFSGRQSSLSAGGEYEINADIGFAYLSNNFTMIGPQGLKVRKDIFQNLTGASIGPRGLLFRHEVTITAGLGAEGFTAGPQFMILTSLGTAKGSDVGIIPCKGTTLSMHLKGGVGWTIARPIVKVINTFLRLINVDPIRDHGGVHSEYKRLFTQQTWTESKSCGGPEQF